MTTKLQVCLDLKAVEQLLGGNSEVEVQLRTGVVQEFAKAYLKPLLHDAGIEYAKQVVAADIKKATLEEAKKYFETSGWQPVVTLAAYTKGLIKDECKRRAGPAVDVEKAIRDQVAEWWAAQAIPILQDRIDTYLRRHFDAAVQVEVERRFQHMVRNLSKDTP